MALAYCMGNTASNNGLYYSNTIIVMMIVEIIACFVIFRFYSIKQYNASIKKSKAITLSKNYLVIYFSLILMFAYSYFMGAFNRIHFIWSLQSYAEQVIDNNNLDADSLTSLGGLLFTTAKTLLAVTLIQKIYDSNFSIGLKKLLYVLVIGLSCTFILDWSRFSLIQFVIPLLILVSILLPNKDAKKLTIYAVTIILTVITIASVAKFSRNGNESTVSSLIDVTSLNAYFSGPDNIKYGLLAYNGLSGKDSILFLLNDTFQNVPIINKITDDQYKLNVVFNKEIYGHTLFQDQIVPLDISGLFHFGILGIPFYYCFFIAIALYFERLFFTTNNFLYKFVWISLATTLCYIFMMNISTFYGISITMTGFLLIPLILINLFKVKKSNR